GIVGLPEMQVEAGEHAWFWAAPGNAGFFVALAFVKPECCSGLDGSARKALYLSLLERTKIIRPCLCGPPVGRIRLTHTTCREHPVLIRGNLLRVGKSAFAMDPVSSRGVEAALRSGLQASAVVHTILGGGDRDAAIDFKKNSQRGAARRHRKITADIYATQ